MPQKASIYEGENVVYIVASHLKVMLEQDYLALKENRFNKQLGMDRLKTQETEQLSDLSSEITKEIILPEIEREVNEGENFAVLRQIFHSLILATWMKRHFKKSLLGEVYFDQNRVAGIDIEDKKIKDKIYKQYLAAFRAGVYNFIKEDYDAQTQKIVPRKYFSGGFGSVKDLELVPVDSAALSPEILAQTPVVLVRSELKTYDDQESKMDPLIEDAFKQGNVAVIDDLQDPVVKQFLIFLEFLERYLKNLSFPNASIGNPEEGTTGSPIKTFGDDSLRISNGSIQAVIETFRQLVKKELPAAEGKTVPQLDLLLMDRVPFDEHASDRGAHIVVSSREEWEKRAKEFVKTLAHVYTAFLGQHHATSVAIEFAAEEWVNNPSLSFAELMARLKSREEEFRQRVIEDGYPEWSLGLVESFLAGFQNMSEVVKEGRDPELLTKMSEAEAENDYQRDNAAINIPWWGREERQNQEYRQIEKLAQSPRDNDRFLAINRLHRLKDRRGIKWIWRIMEQAKAQPAGRVQYDAFRRGLEVLKEMINESDTQAWISGYMRVIRSRSATFHAKISAVVQLDELIKGRLSRSDFLHFLLTPDKIGEVYLVYDHLRQTMRDRRGWFLFDWVTDILAKENQPESFAKIVDRVLNDSSQTIPEESVITMLSDKDPEVRNAAARFLGRKGSKKAVPYLMEALHLQAAGDKADIFRALIQILKDEEEIKKIYDLVGPEDAQSLYGELQPHLWRTISPSLMDAASSAYRNREPRDDPDSYVLRLNDPDENIRAEAAKNFGQTMHRLALTPLLDHRNDPSPLVRQQIAEALGELMHARAIEPLMEMTLDADESVRKAAFAALEKLYVDPRQIKKFYIERLRKGTVLESELEVMVEFERRQRFNFNLEITTLQSFDSQFSFQMERFLRYSVEDWENWKQSHAVGLGALVSFILDEKVLKQIQFENSPNRELHAQVVSILINALSHQNIEVQQEAVTALQRIHDRRAIEPLGSLLASPNADLSESARIAMHLQGASDREWVEANENALLNAEEQPDPLALELRVTVKTAKWEALSYLTQYLNIDKGIEPYLITAVTDYRNSAELRYQVLQAINLLDELTSAYFLLPLTHDQDERIRSLATAILRDHRLSTDEEIDAYGRILLESSNPQVQTLAINQLQEHAERLSGARRQMAAYRGAQGLGLVQAITQEDYLYRRIVGYLGEFLSPKTVTAGVRSAEVQTLAAGVLAQMGDQRVLGVLKDLLKHEVVDVQDQTINALIRIRDLGIVPYLFNLLEDPNFAFEARRVLAGYGVPEDELTNYIQDVDSRQVIIQDALSYLRTMTPTPEELEGVVAMIHRWLQGTDVAYQALALEMLGFRNDSFAVKMISDALLQNMVSDPRLAAFGVTVLSLMSHPQAEVALRPKTEGGAGVLDYVLPQLKLLEDREPYEAALSAIAPKLGEGKPWVAKWITAVVPSSGSSRALAPTNVDPGHGFWGRMWGRFRGEQPAVETGALDVDEMEVLKRRLEEINQPPERKVKGLLEERNPIHPDDHAALGQASVAENELGGIDLNPQQIDFEYTTSDRKHNFYNENSADVTRLYDPHFKGFFHRIMFMTPVDLPDALGL